jgi:hypothetical protein
VAEYKRSMILVNPKFQYKVSLMVCGITFISFILYPYTIIQMIENFASLHPESTNALKERRDELLTLFTIFHLVFTSIVFLTLLRITHKIAGPIYKLVTTFKKIREGAKPERIVFRSSDYFHELAFEASKLFEHFDETRKQEIASLDKAIEQLQELANHLPENKKPVSLEISKSLTEIKNRFSINS